ncbi:hypothetical protein H6F50_13155 [Coleofasciculus sp. FACHB-712]|uniref:DUF6220 domain-containing protein n=1 Tax=Coleofasciculus sp. FACHB-712 TaxID=2692789 RepID=UPI0016859CC4|nr:DUF6220 domain-containing protein [Coleofasciculus sp. FACHB-712]MBD1943288.1 hypothetical protein [Coleofasciculus sp. FACHB-712]
MTINPEIDRADRRAMQVGFYATSVVFNLCLITQLLTVGIAYFISPAWWNIHVWLVRGYGGLSLLLLGWSFFTPFPPQIQRLTASLPVLLGLQFLTIHLKSSLHLEILHPLIGFSLLYVSSSLVHRVWRSLSLNHRHNEQV